MGQHGHRNMYYQTGLPGWVRMGYSPGWNGQPPMAQYLQDTGQLEEAQNWFRQNAAQTQSASEAQDTGQATQQSAREPADPEKQQLRQQVQQLQQQVRDLQNQLNNQQ